MERLEELLGEYRRTSADKVFYFERGNLPRWNEARDEGVRLRREIIAHFTSLVEAARKEVANG